MMLSGLKCAILMVPGHHHFMVLLGTFGPWKIHCLGHISNYCIPFKKASKKRVRASPIATPSVSRRQGLQTSTSWSKSMAICHKAPSAHALMQVLQVMRLPKSLEVTKGRRFGRNRSKLRGVQGEISETCKYIPTKWWESHSRKSNVIQKINHVENTSEASDGVQKSPAISLVIPHHQK